MITLHKNITVFALLLITSIFSVGFFSFHPSKTFAADCKAISAEFRSSGTISFIDNARPLVFVDVKTENCAGKTIEISITERDSAGNDDIAELDNKQIKIPASDSFTLILKAGETACEAVSDPDCHYFIQIYSTSGGVVESYDSLGKSKGELSYNCDGSCFTDWLYAGVAAYGANGLPAATGTAPSICKIFSARFSPFGNHSTDAAFYKNDLPITINILTENCGGKKIYVSLIEYDAPLTEVSMPQAHALTVPSNNSLKINMKAGESGCSGAYDPDCKYAIWVGSQEMLQYIGTNYPDCTTVICMLQMALSNVPGFYYSQSRPQGDLQYDCNGDCFDSWIFSSTEQGEGGVENGQQIIPTNTGTGSTSTYQLLAPLPGISSVDVSKQNALADYLGLIFKLIIGITGVLSVLMIVLGGIEYMTSDVVFSKEEAKKRIWNAILGLLLALGSYAILNTLNPDLLKINLNIPDATVTIPEEGEAGGTGSQIFGDTTSIPCAEGTTPIEKDIAGYAGGKKYMLRLCALPNLASSSNESTPGDKYYINGANGKALVNSSVSGAWHKLISASAKDGITLRAASSFRTWEHQNDLCGGTCDGSLVAKPGYSPHQMGFAIDFTGTAVKGSSSTSCTGRAIDPNSPTWKWLSTNASTFGIKQYSNESWHWDTLTMSNRC